jgi:DNA-binding transcriptional ArsR family regulator
MNDEEAEPSEPSPYDSLRRISDARELRALAHPVRMALYEALAVNRSLTATQASRIVGGSPSSVSYHLRTLAKYGYVEESIEGTGRERPWQMTRVGFSFTENSEDPEANAAAEALSRQLFKRWLGRREAFQQARDRWPEEVRNAVADWNSVLFGTTEEFIELQADFANAFAKYVDRVTHPELRPEGSRIFELQLFTHPIDPSSFTPADEPATEEN